MGYSGFRSHVQLHPNLISERWFHYFKVALECLAPFTEKVRLIIIAISIQCHVYTSVNVPL